MFLVYIFTSLFFLFFLSQYSWEQLYKASAISGREVGTLYNFRQKFSMTNVYSSVKKNYKSAEHLMLCSTKAYIYSAFMNWAEFDTLDGVPKNIIIPDNGSSKAEKK